MTTTQLDKLNALCDSIIPESTEEQHLNDALDNANFTALFEGGAIIGTEEWAELVLTAYHSN